MTEKELKIPEITEDDEWLAMAIPVERYEELKLKENELERCKKKCESLINHLIRARAKGYYDYESVDYGSDKV